mmetsp:Transcript_13585/g.29400  ORF Transcript_13585/g.29400 Transcript_13585/m.29400 type:complete len:239 (-) Transcript_13585:2158-2874(-)
MALNSSFEPPWSADTCPLTRAARTGSSAIGSPRPLYFFKYSLIQRTSTIFSIPKHAEISAHQEPTSAASSTRLASANSRMRSTKWVFSSLTFASPSMSFSIRCPALLWPFASCERVGSSPHLHPSDVLKGRPLPTHRQRERERIRAHAILCAVMSDTACSHPEPSRPSNSTSALAASRTAVVVVTPSSSPATSTYGIPAVRCSCASRCAGACLGVASDPLHRRIWGKIVSGTLTRTSS